MAKENQTPPEGDQNPPAQAPVAVPPAGTVTTEALHAAIQKAREEERAKFSGQQELLNTQLAEMKQLLEQANETARTLKAQLEAVEKAKGPNGEIDIPALLEKYSQDVAEKTSKEYQTVSSEQAKRLEALEKENQQYRLERQRAELIAAAGGESVMIVEMVGGNTPEEIRHSIERAKQAYDRIAGKARTPGAAAPVEPAVTPTPELAPSAGGTPNGGGGATPLSNVKRMSSEEYSANRDKILRQVNTEHGGGRPFQGNRRGSDVLRGR